MPPEEKPKSNWLKALGPGLVTGASDDDPSGIGTYSQVAAQFGYGILWTVLFSYPLMAVIQEISARIGSITGVGLAGNIRRNYSRSLLYAMVSLIAVANIINLAADISAMGAAMTLLIGGSQFLSSAILAIVALVLVVLIPYHRYVSILKWLSLALFAYIITAFVVHPPWLRAIRGLFIPTVVWNTSFLTSLVAVLGTTISPYLFVWQASEEVEEELLEPDQRPLREIPHRAALKLHWIRVDTYIGMAFSNLVALFIMLTVAATLHAGGIYSIESAAEAASALRPLAGQYAFLLFAMGIVGTGMLALPILAGSAAYAVGEALHWPVGLERQPLHAMGFYGVLAASILMGIGLNLARVNPIQALFWSAVINGVAAGPLMIVMMQMASNPEVMGELTLSPGLKALGWIATAVMILCGVGMLLTL